MRNFLLAALTTVFLLGGSLWAIQVFLSTSDEFKIAIITLIGSIFAISIQHKKTKEREIQGRLFQQKADAYENIFSLIQTTLRLAKEDKLDPTDEIILEKMYEIKKSLLIWGSDETIKAWEKIETISPNSNAAENARSIFDRWGNLYWSMRKDLGHNDKLIKPIDLVALHLNEEGRREMGLLD